jgi:methionyl-tRNA synthetase
VSEKTFYITTPLYYVNDVPHVGHAYATIGADVLARYMRAQGRKVFLMTGTDEHGQKIAKAAAEKGHASPQALADEVAPRFNELWKVLNISHDRFFRTTDADHRIAAQEFFARVRAAGFLEKRGYEGWYSVADETFWLESQLKQPGNLAPDSGQPCVKMKEENWFFLQSHFKERLKAYLAAHPDFIQPDLRRNEILGSYLNAEDGVHDTSVTRSSVKWGIPVPGDEGQVLYVWFDALINYLTGTGWPKENIDGRWPADVHIIGKDILRFHAVLWPAMLLAAGFKEDQLPKQVFGTGLILRDGVKMSKTLNNGVDPHEWAGRYGVETLRYYLLREVPFGQDGSISDASIESRYNTELANDVGNLLSRTLGMMEKYIGATVPALPAVGSDGLKAELQTLGAEYAEAMKGLQFHTALEAVLKRVRRANQYVDEQAPWTLFKQGAESLPALENCLYNLAETARMAALALAPFMPEASDKALQRLGFAPQQFFDARTQAKGASLSELLAWGGLPAGNKVAKGEPLFPRREVAKV